MKINNPNLFFFPPNSIKVRESQSTKDCIVLISKREREKVEYCSCGNFQLIIYPHQTLWERGRGQAWGRKFSTHLFLTFEEQIADYAHVGNFPETFATFWHCVSLLKNLQHKRGQTTFYHISLWLVFFLFAKYCDPFFFLHCFSLAFLSVFYTPFWLARRALAFSNVKSSYIILSILPIYFTTYTIF